MKVLYVEDELNLASIVQDTLSSSGYEVSLVTDGVQVMPQLEQFSPQICVLDVMLPSIDGFTLGKQIAKTHPQVPILFLTSKSGPEDVLTGFRSGGNDYLKKPFSMEELMVRIDNLIALSSGVKHKTESSYQLGAYAFHMADHTLRHGDETRTLSYREVELLEYLCKRLNTIIDKKDLMLAIWGDDSYYNARNLDVYIKKLRGYLENDPAIQIITLRGIGYKFVVGGVGGEEFSRNHVSG